MGLVILKKAVPQIVISFRQAITLGIANTFVEVDMNLTDTTELTISSVCPLSSLLLFFIQDVGFGGGGGFLARIGAPSETSKVT